MKYRITNKTSATIILEDMGVTLQRAGGQDSSQVVSAPVYEASRDAQKSRLWVLVEKIHEPAMTESRSNLPSIPLAPLAPVLVSPSSIPVPDSPLPNAEMVAMHATMREMNERMAQVVKILEQAPLSGSPAVSSSFQAPGVHSGHETYVPPTPEAIYIPGHITPKDAQTHIQSEDGSSAAGDFDEAAATLKNLRKKK